MRKLLDQNLASMRLTFALEVVEDYEANRPKNVYPHSLEITRGIDDWPAASLCYSGLEQAFKLLIRERCGDKKARKLNGHSLLSLYKSLPSEDQIEIASYYRVYRSFNRFTRPPRKWKTAKQFIKAISDDYTAWRYTLIEDQSHPARVYPHFMLEIWRALLHLGGGSQGRSIDFLRIDKRVEFWFENFLSPLFMENDLFCEKKTVDAGSFTSIIDWVEKERKGYLDTGLHVFRHLREPSKFPLDPKTRIFRNNLLKAAAEVVKCIKSRKRFWHTGILCDGWRDQRWQEMEWAYFMCLEGLSWNTQSELFEIGKSGGHFSGTH